MDWKTSSHQSPGVSPHLKWQRILGQLVFARGTKSLTHKFDAELMELMFAQRQLKGQVCNLA